jgi:hypothetical protein
LSLFRRREPLHVRLAREGGLLESAREPLRPAWDNAGIHGVQRARQWDSVATVDAPELEGDHAVFVALSPEQLVVEEGPHGVEALAAALGRDPAPPYRAEAVRRDGTVWAVAARRIEIVRLPDLSGEEIELSTHAGERTLLIDGERTFGSIPALERPEQFVRAKRVAGDAWEVEIHQL